MFQTIFFFVTCMQSEAEEKVLNRKFHGKMEKTIKERQRIGKITPELEDQFMSGRILGKLCILVDFLRKNRMNANQAFNVETSKIHALCMRFWSLRHFCHSYSE